MAKKNEIILSFCIWEFDDITHDEITSLIGLPPTTVHIKGERINPKFAQIAKGNSWILGSPYDDYTPFDDQMNFFLDLIESKLDVFKSLTSKYFCEFSCALYIYSDNEESTPSVHLFPRYNKIIMKEVNIEFDLDLYCL